MPLMSSRGLDKRMLTFLGDIAQVWQRMCLQREKESLGEGVSLNWKELDHREPGEVVLHGEGRSGAGSAVN